MSRMFVMIASLVMLVALVGASACAQQQAQAPASADQAAEDDTDDAKASATNSGDDAASTEDDDDSPEPTPAPAKQLDKLSKSVDKALAAAQTGDLVKAKSEYVKSGERWTKTEPTVKAKSAEAQAAIAASMQEVQTALVTEAAPNKDEVVAALQKLRQTIDVQKPKLA
jgi:hypothetical protein